MKHTAVEFLAEKYNYITWLRNRDEISAGTADEWRAKYLEQAKQMERQQIVDAVDGYPLEYRGYEGHEYYEKTYGNES
jgi:hypothetical protein